MYSKFGYDKNGRSIRLQDTLKVLDQIHGYIKEYKVTQLIYLGDLFQRKSEVSTEVFNNIYFKLKEISKDVRIHLLAGTHDLKEKEFTAATFEFASVYRKATQLTLEDKKIWFIPHDYSIEIKNLYGDILFGHFSIKNLPDKFAADSPYLLEHFQNFDKVFLGHEHLGGEYSNVKFLNCCIPQSWSEKNIVPYVYLLENNLNLKKLRINTPLFLEADYKFLFQNLSHLKNSYIRLLIDSSEVKNVEFYKENLRKYSRGIEVKFITNSKKLAEEKSFSFELKDFLSKYIELKLNKKNNNYLKVGEEIISNAVRKTRL